MAPTPWPRSPTRKDGFWRRTPTWRKTMPVCCTAKPPVPCHPQWSATAYIASKMDPPLQKQAQLQMAAMALGTWWLTCLNQTCSFWLSYAWLYVCCYIEQNCHSEARNVLMWHMYHAYPVDRLYFSILVIMKYCCLPVAVSFYFWKILFSDTSKKEIKRSSFLKRTCLFLSHRSLSINIIEFSKGVRFSFPNSSWHIQTSRNNFTTEVCKI